MWLLKIFSICCLLLCLSCTKDNIEPIDEGCVPLPPTPNIGSWKYNAPDTVHTAPFFNPYNPDEIVIREHNYVEGEFWLCVVNLKSKSKEYIYQNNFSSKPKWGKNDWILFTLADQNIYKIKSNGSQLTQVTNNQRSFDAKWTHDHENILYNTYYYYIDSNNTTVQKGIYILMDLKGNILDTLSENWIYFNSHLAASMNQYSLKIYDGSIDTTRTILTFDPAKASQGSDVFWVDKSTVIWSRLDGVYVTNIVNGSTKQIRETCNSLYYSDPSFSPQLGKIIWRKVEQAVHNDTLHINSSIIWMNTDRKSEDKIQIPR